MNDDQIDEWREDNRRARDSGPPSTFLIKCALLPWAGTREVPQGIYRLIAEDLSVAYGYVAREAWKLGYTSPPDPAASKKAALVEVLNERFPDKVAPRGAWPALAEEFELSTSYVSHVAAEVGVRSDRYGGPLRKRVLKDLKRRYPGRRYPRGQLKVLAAHYGVSYIYLQTLAREIGLRSET